MAKTKTIRATLDDAFKIEQAARELAATTQREVKVSEIVTELMECLESAKENIKKRAGETSH